MIFFHLLKITETNEKKNNEKKKGAERIGLLPNYIVKKKKICVVILLLYRDLCAEGWLV